MASSMAATGPQAGMFARVSTPLGADVLVLRALDGREAMSELFRFSLRMQSDSVTLDPAEIVGKTLTVTLQRAGGEPRYVHGIVTRFAQVARGSVPTYTAEIAPRLWLLTLGRDRAIYQNLSAFAIIKQVLGVFGVTFESQVEESRYLPREYCVQYDESPFDFISRLMEEEGIFYFFRFGADGHTMVLADSPDAHADCIQGATVMAYAVRKDPKAEQISAFTVSRELGPATQVLADYDFVQALTSQGTAQADAEIAAPGAQQYLFPGKHADAGEAGRKAAVRQAAQQVEAHAGDGESTCYALSAGSKFTMTGHVNPALNVAYVLRSVTHSWWFESGDIAGPGTALRYGNVIGVLPLTVPFRAPQRTPRPLVAGTHTAVVTGLDGEEIWTDKHGRIKIKFHWDRAPKADQDSSCWVRVAQSLAGPGWGHLFLPRVGHEVVVSYVDGDPDRPLVTGCVYNGKMTPPVALPGAQTQSVMRSRSSKGGTAGNELRMEDKTGAEELYLRAQRDMTVSVQNKLATTVVEGGESHLVQKGDRAVAVQSGNETHDVSGTRKTEITGAETHTNGAAFTQDVAGNYKLTVSGNLTIEVSGAISIKAGTTFASKAGATLTTDAATITHKASGMQTVESGGILTLKGALVKLN